MTAVRMIGEIASDLGRIERELREHTRCHMSVTCSCLICTARFSLLKALNDLVEESYVERGRAIGGGVRRAAG